MSIILKQKITGPAAWKGGDFVGDTSWIHHLSGSEIELIDSALAHVKARGLTFPDFTREDFPISELAPFLKPFADELENGRGFLLLRGLPVERYSDEDINTVYYGLGLHLGVPVRQNPRGDLLGTVMNVGDPKDKKTRVYETNLYLPYHSDPSDVVGLLCVRKASAGGLSSLVSVAAIYNEILEKHPEYLGLYYRPMYFAHLCETMICSSQTTMPSCTRVPNSKTIRLSLSTEKCSASGSRCPTHVSSHPSSPVATAFPRRKRYRPEFNQTTQGNHES